MDVLTEYVQALSVALSKKAVWLEKNELPKLKDGCRMYHTSFASLYNLYIRKGLIHEDPYKQESKIGELEALDARPFTDGKRADELTLRLAAYDNQIDFLVNYYQFSVDFINLDRIKRIAGLIKYIEWTRLTPDSQSAVTKAVAEMTNQIKTGTDQLTMSLISECLSHLTKYYAPIMNCLKQLADYQRESYKLEIRETVTSKMPPGEAAQLSQIKKKFAQANPGKHFYPDLVEEVINEDNAKEGPEIREKILKSLQVAEEKPKVAKQEVNYKAILLEGIVVTGSTAPAFTDILAKMDENKAVLENEQSGFWFFIKKLLQQMLKRDPDPVIYDLEYLDAARGVPVHEKVNFNAFRSDLERRVKTLAAVNIHGPGIPKLKALPDEQLITFLERNIRDIQNFHKILGGLDEFFKGEVNRADRDKVKGIKPELATIKNATIRANSKRHEYSAQKEEEEQLKRLGVSISG